jgi:hypothetical protein
MLRYDEEYAHTVWSHYSCSATYPKLNCANEVHEHVIAPVDMGVGAESENGALFLVGSKAEKVSRGLASSGGISRPSTSTWKISNQFPAQTRMCGPISFPDHQSKMPALHPTTALGRANAGALSVVRRCQASWLFRKTRRIMMREAKEKRMMAVLLSLVYTRFTMMNLRRGTVFLRWVISEQGLELRTGGEN